MEITEHDLYDESGSDYFSCEEEEVDENENDEDCEINGILSNIKHSSMSDSDKKFNILLAVKDYIDYLSFNDYFSYDFEDALFNNKNISFLKTDEFEGICNLSNQKTIINYKIEIEKSTYNISSKFENNFKNIMLEISECKSFSSKY
mgnify:CR=1 FL=1